ncbi:hypothetical protein GCM10010168_18070 [Actinoplanes ianthinogenes]|uniref:DUF362 domain-containing protein n=1 Tax=Actinoplanes ianthinogenes TaxID=122358 RepID=A0ABN6CS31_9ACTN|nr:DUF362 domain-containing protein [Actinoplanes ianthinogenes]BCJ47449.1 hypothetical protein Aiant_81060 [Actinoplanes ianthinogenes]GGR01840.1 hypothetical protein GCM10010168_18070 [Actinoplanes ianthinogenes]
MIEDRPAGWGARLIAETERLLAAWRTAPGGDPALERLRLMLLALEREQIVSKAYDEAVVAERVASLPVSDAVRALVHHALVWAWKDEELHTIYIRGRLLSVRRHRARVYARQVVGVIGGWVSATRHHRSFSRSWLGWPVATVVLLAGRLSGQVSRDLAAGLSYQSFARYCALNEALERSAELCYERLIQLAADPVEQAQFERIRADEQRHREMFAVLARSFDAADRPAAGTSEATIIAGLAKVSEWFLPGEHRGIAARRSWPATGGPVWVAELPGVPLEAALFPLLDDAGLGDLVRARPGRVAIRTAFILGYSRADRSNIVSPELIGALSRYVRRHGATDVAVLEAPSVYERVYARRSVGEVARYFGFEAPEYRIVDVQSDQRPLAFDRGISQSTASGTWLDADVRIVVPKLRTDPRQGGHLSLNSLVGTGMRTEQTVYAGRELDHESAIMMLLDACPPDFAIVDGWGPVATGLFGVMGCDRPVTLHRLYAGPDPVSVDWQALADMGIPDPGRVPLVRRARHWFGRDVRPARVHGDVGPIAADLRLPGRFGLRRVLARLASPVYVYASRSGEVFVPAMDTEAFPPLRRAGPGTRFVRWATQRAFGLRPPA